MSKEYDKEKRQPEAQNIRKWAQENLEEMIDKYLLTHQKITEKYYITRDWINFDDKHYKDRRDMPIDSAKECFDIVYGSIVLPSEEIHRAGKRIGGGMFLDLGSEVTIFY